MLFSQMKADKFTINKKGIFSSYLYLGNILLRDMGLQAKSLAALKGRTEDKITL